jgi:hypothetical protein
MGAIKGEDLSVCGPAAALISLYVESSRVELHITDV